MIHPLLGLQRSAGNAAVNRLLQATRADGPAADPTEVVRRLETDTGPGAGVGLGAKGAEKAGEAALDMGSKVGVELSLTLEMGDGGLEAAVELKHVKAMSVELPSILEVELLRKKRLGIAHYQNGAWTVSL